jgi:hypothetical protein
MLFMEQLIFGTFNVPPLTNMSQSASFTAPGKLSKEILEKIIYTEDSEKSAEPELSNFDKTLKGLLNVPKPNH